MSKNLVIVESPAKAHTIEKYLGGDFKVLASVGHIRKDTKVDKTTFDVTYEIFCFTALISVSNIFTRIVSISTSRLGFLASCKFLDKSK